MHIKKSLTPIDYHGPGQNLFGQINLLDSDLFVGYSQNLVLSIQQVKMYRTEFHLICPEYAH